MACFGEARAGEGSRSRRRPRGARPWPSTCALKESVEKIWRRASGGRGQVRAAEVGTTLTPRGSRIIPEENMQRILFGGGKGGGGGGGTPIRHFAMEARDTRLK